MENLFEAIEEFKKYTSNIEVVFSAEGIKQVDKEVTSKLMKDGIKISTSNNLIPLFCVREYKN